ncbi:hypothetical protein [Paenibacillus lignilyticus]|uniref:hypothetical protein n=1 Tax=Paenibacillus lignilyticus TaxID=1172615 RepID=UPI00308401F2
MIQMRDGYNVRENGNGEGHGDLDTEVMVQHTAPEAGEYIALRLAAGLSPKDEAAARIALKNSIYAVSLRSSDKLVGMGRIIGDGV